MHQLQCLFGFSPSVVGCFDWFCICEFRWWFGLFCHCADGVARGLRRLEWSVGYVFGVRCGRILVDARRVGCALHYRR